ncbi:unnamed protein product [Paramecium pentaurelia]|uniref:SHSP domain-containing protein n=1 Tax=Paramecium pentaurelia TaxID=43138 RepID=A0A8S1UZQ0_9CILI|nr:unnamed protein product [Paramecium pentaurelia]
MSSLFKEVSLKQVIADKSQVRILLKQKIQILVTMLKDIQKEEEEIMKQFNKMTKEAKSIEELYEIMEMINYEMSVRNSDKLIIMDEINQQEEYLLQLQASLESQVRNTLKEFETSQKFQQTRSLRQTGRFLQFKDNNHNLNMENSNVQSNIITSYDFEEQSRLYDKIQDNIFNDPTKYNSQEGIDETQVYDWILDIDLINNVQFGWPVYISRPFQAKMELVGLGNNNNNNESKSSIKWEGATVAVVGLYDKGKTFVLNNLTQSNLPSGKKVTTKGISFKHVDVDSGTQLILVDTAGSYSPVKIQSALSIVEKEATEHFIIDLVFELSDYFICVVNDFTSLDQRYLDRLSRQIQNSSKTFREIIVVHNLKEIETSEILQHVWTTQVTQIYSTGGSIQRTKVAANNPRNNELQAKHVLWFKTQYTRHVCLVSDDSQLGLDVNPWVFSLLKYWLKSVFVPVNRQFSVCESILQYSTSKLTQYFKREVNVKLIDTDNQFVKKIVQMEADLQNGQLKIPQTNIDQSGLILARPDSFAPATDIIANDKYTIYMDVPGISEEDIEMYRQNVVTIVKGNRKKPYQEEQSDHIKKQERKYGEFTLSFRIPENFERKWKHFGIENGVLKIVYEKDKDDIIPNQFMSQNE